MSDPVMQEYPTAGDRGNQRYAICQGQWDNRKKDADTARGALQFLDG